ncbi:hypothetical protein ACIGEH_10050 [Bacillus altitudinis]|uniref:hypothetical protein n=1 Tax=Bacillus altitudinis TaxID=293387 RepID=UPI0037C57883
MDKSQSFIDYGDIWIQKGRITFNIGDIVFQVFSLLFIALIVTIVVIGIQMIRRKQVELKKVEAR